MTVSLPELWTCRIARWITRWKPAGGGGVDLAFDAQALELLIEIGDDDVGQFAEIDTAGLHHLGGIGIVDQRQQQMLQRRIFMGAVACMLERVVERCFQRFRK